MFERNNRRILWIVAVTLTVAPITYGCATDSGGQSAATNREIIEQLSGEEKQVPAEAKIVDPMRAAEAKPVVLEDLEPAGEEMRSHGRAGNRGTQRSNTVRADTIPPTGQRRLVNDQVRLQGRINTLDRRLRDFDNGISLARDLDPSGVSALDPPQSINWRLDQERRALKARVKADQRQLQRLQFQQLIGSRQPVPGTGSSSGLLRR